jgi:transcriptional regulator NrdR family protein
MSYSNTLPCRLCNSKNTRVVSTDRLVKLKTKRYCRCMNCNSTFCTIEQYEKIKKNSRRKLTGAAKDTVILQETDVLKLRKMHADGVKQIKLATIFGISHQHVSSIVNRKKWTHV